MSRADLLVRAARLSGAGEPFVLATVVRRTPPSSARPGYRAIVLRDGTLEGWLGGSCIEPVVRREAAEALRLGEPRLLVFSPEPDRVERPGVHAHPMTCHSGGTVEVYLEPELPAPLLCLYGDSPVSRALARMAEPLGWRVRVVGGADASAFEGAELVERAAVTGEPSGGDGAPSPDRSPSPEASPEDAACGWAVVATMGEWDETAVERALGAGFPYVGMVGSPRRAAEVRRTLGLGEDDGRLVSPAGLDVGAREPAEIAVTILAEILQRRGEREAPGGERADATGPAGTAGSSGGEPARPEVAVDPVCGMEVVVGEAAATSEHDGVTYHFCADGCRRRFEEDPERWL